jgi:hypothetical protein
VFQQSSQRKNRHRFSVTHLASCYPPYPVECAFSAHHLPPDTGALILQSSSPYVVGGEVCAVLVGQRIGRSSVTPASHGDSVVDSAVVEDV